MVDENSQQDNDGEVVGDKSDELRASQEKFLGRLIEYGFLEDESNNGEEGYRLTGKGIMFLEKMCSLLELFCNGDVVDDPPDKLV